MLVKEVVPPKKGQSDVLMGALIGAISIIGTLVVMCGLAVLISDTERVRVTHVNKFQREWKTINMCEVGYTFAISSRGDWMRTLPSLDSSWTIENNTQTLSLDITSISNVSSMIVDHTDQR